MLQTKFPGKPTNISTNDPTKARKLKKKMKESFLKDPVNINNI
jgi:hypothetical protein